MAETVVVSGGPSEGHSEHAGDSPVEGLAEAMADAQVEAAHTLEAEARLEHATETAEAALTASQDAHAEAALHEHSEYASVDHTHGDNYEGRLAALEARLAESVQTAQEEVVEPVQNASAEIPATEKTVSRGLSFRRGRG